MFGKLFKYDFKSNYKWYCITFAILLTLSILMGFITGSSLRPEVMERYSEHPLSISGVIITFYLLFLLLFSASCAVFLSNTIIIIRRFYKKCLWERRLPDLDLAGHPASDSSVQASFRICLDPLVYADHVY